MRKYFITRKSFPSPYGAACSRRKSQETTYPDGSTLKRSIFTFAGFRRYGSP